MPEQMPEPSTAQEILAELISQEDTLGCIRCGQCSYNCPTYRALQCESAAPRGRIALLRASAEGKLDPTELFAKRLYDCTLCAACTAACPGGLEVDRLLLEARQGLFDAGLAPAPTQQLGRQIQASHNIAGDGNEGRLVWCDNMECRPTGEARAHADVAYFVGCVGSLFPMSYSIPQTFVKCLEAAGLDYALLGGDEWCCGYPALIGGNRPLTEELARHNIEAVRRLGARTIVATCPSCYHMFTHTYPQIIASEMDGIDVLHATELLAQLVDQGRLSLGPVEATVTYHDPCDLGRKSTLYEPARRVLRAIPGVKLVEMASNRADALCCGGGGNVETNDPALVAAMSARRLAQAEDCGAQTIVTACQQCKRTLTAAARREKKRIRTLDLSEIVWQSIEKT